MTSFKLVFQITLVMLSGVILRKLNIVDEHFGKNLSSVIFNLVLPCLVLTSFMGSFSEGLLRNTPQLLGLFAAFMAVMYICAASANRIINKKDPLSRSLVFATICPNATFVGLPLINELLGVNGVICLMILMIPTRVLVFMGTPLIMTLPDGRTALSESIRTNWKNMLNPPTIAIPLSIALYLIGVSFPEPLFKAMTSISSMASPLGMMFCGVLLSDLPMRRLFEEPRVFIMALLRNLIAPAAVFGLLCLIGVRELFFRVAMIYCCMPIAATMSIYSTKYECDGLHSSMAIFLSTVLSIATIPLWLWLTDLVL